MTTNTFNIGPLLSVDQAERIAKALEARQQVKNRAFETAVFERTPSAVPPLEPR